MPEHLGIVETKARQAIITGDPHRVSIIAAHLDSPTEISDARGFVCIEGVLSGEPVLVVSTGIGAPATAIVVEELTELGIDTIIRLGTCGALQSSIKVGDWVIATGAVREEGTTAQYIGLSFPALAHFNVLQHLSAAAQQRQLRYHVGITHCKDAYYTERSDRQLDPQATTKQWDTWKKAGVLATEMEAAPLFVLGSLRNIRTGAILMSVGHDKSLPLLAESLQLGIMTVMDALKSLGNA